MNLSLTGHNLTAFKRAWEEAWQAIPQDERLGINEARLYLAGVDYVQTALGSPLYTDRGILGLLQALLSMARTSQQTLETGQSRLLGSDDVLQGYLALKALIVVEQEALARDSAPSEGASDTVPEGISQYQFHAAFTRGEEVNEALYRLRESFLTLRTLESSLRASVPHVSRIYRIPPFNPAEPDQMRAFRPTPQLEPGEPAPESGQKVAMSLLVDEMAERWGTEQTWLHEIIGRPSIRSPYEMPGNSRLVSLQMGFWFGVAIGDALFQILKGRLKRDPKLEDFNRELPVICDYIMQASGWRPHINQESLQAIARAVGRAQMEGRPLLVTSTHESWTDITAIGGLLRELPNRFVYKKELELVPGLGFVLIFADMTPVVRPPRESADPEKTKRAKEKAIGQVARVKDKISRAGIVSVDFTPGTRTRAGAGVGEAKKGFANLAIDLNAAVLVLNVEGTSQIMPVSWGEFLATKGAGTNRRIDVRALDIYPEDYLPEGALSDSEKRKAQVQAMRDSAEKIQVENGLAIIKEWHSQATPLGEASNRERFQLNELLDHFAEAFELVDHGDTQALEAWCAKKRVALNFVKALKDWMPADELEAVYQRTGKRENVEIVSAPGIVDDDQWEVSLPDESLALEALAEGGTHLAVTVKPTGLGEWMFSGLLQFLDRRLKGKIAKGLSPLISANTYTPDEQYVLALTYLKGVLRATPKLAKEWWRAQRGAYEIPSLEEKPLPPAGLIKKPITRDDTLSILTRFVQNHPDVEIPDEVEARLAAAYGLDSELLREAREMTRRYLHFTLEDTRRFLEIYRQDQPVDETLVEQFYSLALESSKKVTWRGETVDPFIFAALRDIRDAGSMITRPEEPALQELYDQIILAEEELNLIPHSSPTLRNEEVERRLFQAREKVREAYAGYAGSAGLSTSHETFSYLHQYGFALKPSIFQHAVYSIPELKESPIATGLVEVHRAWHEAYDELTKLKNEMEQAIKQAKSLGKKGEDPAQIRKRFELRIHPLENRVKRDEEKFQDQMRYFLDVPGWARKLQYQLIRIHATREALLKSKREVGTNNGLKDLMAVMVSAVYPSVPQMSRPREVVDYQVRYNIWRSAVVVESRFNDIPGLHNPALHREVLQAQEALDRVEVALLDSPAGPPVIDQASVVFEKIRGMEGLENALEDNANYWRTRRNWGEVENDRQEKLLGTKIDYLAFRENEIAETTRKEAHLLFEGALRLMAEARRRGTVDSGLKGLYDSAIKERHKVIADLDKQTERRREHWERLSNPARVADNGEKTPLGHSISWNRAIENAHKTASCAFNAAGRAYAQATGEPAPKPVSLTSTALHDKLLPTSDRRVHAERVDNFIGRYIGDLVVPAVVHALWVIQNKLPAEYIDPLIKDWALKASRDFHIVRLDDRRHSEKLPGVEDVADLAHNGGWYLDYSTGLIMSPKGEVYVLISKNDLGGKMFPGMAEGVEVLAQLLPEDPSQAVNEARIIDTSLYGLNNDFMRRGAQNVLLYGAGTMGVLENPDPVALADPSLLLNPKYTTGLDLMGFGRSASLWRGRIAIQGTSARTRAVVSMNYGGHSGGPKPDKPFGVKPAQMDTVVKEIDPLTLPRGVALLRDEETLPSFTERHAGEVAVQWTRREGMAEFSARRLRHDEIGGAPLTIVEHDSPLLHDFVEGGGFHSSVVPEKERIVFHQLKSDELVETIPVGDGEEEMEEGLEGEGREGEAPLNLEGEASLSELSVNKIPVPGSLRVSRTPIATRLPMAIP